MGTVSYIRVQTRQLAPKEWQAFRDIRLEALAVEAAKYGSSLAAEKSYPKRWWRQFLEDEGQCVFGLFLGDQIIGMSAVRTWNDSILRIAAAKDWPTNGYNKTAFAISSYIKPEYRGKGWFKKLMEDSIDWAAQRPEFCRILLAYRQSNFIIRNLCARLECYKIETHPYEWVDGSREDIVIEAVDLEKWRNDYSIQKTPQRRSSGK